MTERPLADAGAFDVAVIGGGPAGTAAALTLRHYSPLSVALIEKSDYATPRIGETLSPGVQALLQYLHVWEAFSAAGHQPSFGTAAAWGSASVQTRDFIFSPYGLGWHLDRRRFDRMLAEALAEAGGAIWPKTTLRHCRRNAAGVWHLTLQHDGQTVQMQARFVIDATGKAHALAKQVGAQRWVLDRLVAVAGTFTFPPHAAPQNTLTLVEACADGWWYSAQLPGAEMLVAFMSDSDIVRAHALGTAPLWLAALAGAEHTYARVQAGHLAGTLQIHPAHSAYLTRAVGAGWLATGDAAASYDPLSSSGIPRALDAGIFAARAAHDALQHGRSSMLEQYDAYLQQAFSMYHSTKVGYYQIEQRWPLARFWQRRQRVATLDPRGVLHCARFSARDPAWQGLSMDVSPRVYALLCELCTTPAPAHQIVATFQQASRRQLPDQRVILALQELVQQGVIAVRDSVLHSGLPGRLATD